MVRNNKNKKFNQGNRSEARSRQKTRRGDVAMHEARDDKHFFDASLPARDPYDDRFDPDDARDMRDYAAAGERLRKETKPRDVVVAGVPKGKLSHTTSVGGVDKTYVAHRDIIKPRSTKWVDYKSQVIAKVAKAGNVEARSRIEREGRRNDYAGEVAKLCHRDGWTITATRFLGYSIGQGQATRQLKRMCKELAPGHVYLVPDYPGSYVIVLPGKFVKLPGEENQLVLEWPLLVGAVTSPVFSEGIPEVVMQGFDAQQMVTALLYAIFSRANVPIWDNLIAKCLVGDADTYATFTREIKRIVPAFVSEHGLEVVAMLYELRASACVADEQMATYMNARAFSSLAMKWNGDGSDTDASYRIRTSLIAHPLVLSFIRGIFPEEVPQEAIPAVAQGFLIDMLSGKCKIADRATVATGVVAIASAIYVLVRAKTEKFDIARALGAAMRSILRMPTKIDTVEDAVEAIIKFFPLVFSSVAAAIKLGSVSPLFGDPDNTFTRFVDLASAFDLHKRGQYPNTFYATSVDFGAALDTVYQEMRPMARSKDPTALRHWGYLVEMRTNVLNNNMGKWKQAPYGVAITGESSIAKSLVMSLVSDMLAMKKFGRVLETHERHTIQPNDKFDSGLRMDQKEIIFDDIGNARPVQGAPMPNPAPTIIDVVNNVTRPANSADLGDKGCISYNATFCFATSNMRELGITQFTNKPISVLRRFDVFVIPTVRPRYRKHASYALDPTKVPSPHDVPIPDLWTFEVYVPRENIEDRLNNIVWDPVYMEDDSIFGLFDLLEPRMEAHFTNQEALELSQQTKRYLDFTRDQLRQMSAEFDEIPPPAVAQSFGACDSLLSQARAIDCVRGFRRFIDRAARPLGLYYVMLRERLVLALAHRLLSGIPPIYWLWAIGITHFLNAVGFTSWGTSITISGGCYVLADAIRVRDLPVTREGRGTQSPAFAPNVGLMAGVAAIVGYCLLTRAPPTAVAQGGLVEHMALERSKPRVLVVPEHVYESSTTTTFGNLLDKVANVGVFAQLACGPVRAVAVLFPVKTGYYVTNRHIVLPILAAQYAKVDIMMHHRNSSQRHVLSLDQIWVPSPEYDVAFIRVNGPAEINLTRSLMPKVWLDVMQAGSELPANASVIAITRAPVGVKAGFVDVTKGAITTVKQRVQGRPAIAKVRFADTIHKVIRMELIDPTEHGDCGSHLVTSIQLGSGEAPMILGILAGYTDMGVPRVRCNVFAPLTREMVDDAVAHFSTAVFQSSVRLFNQPLDRVLNVTRTHPQLVLPPAYVRPLGVLENKDGVNTVSQNTFTSGYQKGLCYASSGCDRLLGPLCHKFPNQITLEGGTRSYEHYARPLLAMGNKADDFDSRVLGAAEADLLASFKINFSKPPLRPASVFEACNLTLSLPPFSLNTAAGFGRVGNKAAHMEVACDMRCQGCDKFHPAFDDFVSTNRQNFYPKHNLVTEINALEEALCDGRSDVAIFKAALKDEPVGIDKEKIRAFYVGTTALNVVVRRYLMPLVLALAGDARYECMAGIDTDSEQWEHMQLSLEAYDPTQRIGGDYSGFDLSTHPALLSAFYRCLEVLAKDAGWDPRSVRIVRGLGKNLAFPVYIFLGLAVAVAGSNPSGVAVTTHTNSAVNSLLHRYAFYQNNPHLVGRPSLHSEVLTHFTRSVRICTYGDDVIGAIRAAEGVESISNHSVRDAALLFGMVYGAIDKQSALPKYYQARDVQFLKREDVFIPALGRRMGCIAMASIRKAVAFERKVGYEERRSTFSSALRLYYPHAARCGTERGAAMFGDLRSILFATLASSIERSVLDMPAATLPSYEDVEGSIRGNLFAPSHDEVYDM